MKSKATVKYMNCKSVRKNEWEWNCVRFETGAKMEYWHSSKSFRLVSSGGKDLLFGFLFQKLPKSISCVVSFHMNWTLLANFRRIQGNTASIKIPRHNKKLWLKFIKMNPEQRYPIIQYWNIDFLFYFFSNIAVRNISWSASIIRKLKQNFQMFLWNINVFYHCKLFTKRGMSCPMSSHREIKIPPTLQNDKSAAVHSIVKQGHSISWSCQKQLGELLLYPQLLLAVFVPTSVLIHRPASSDNKGLPRAPISRGITRCSIILQNFSSKLDQTQLSPPSPLSFCHWSSIAIHLRFQKEHYTI